MACECDPSWTAERWSHYVHLDNRREEERDYATDLHDSRLLPDDRLVKNKYYAKLLHSTVNQCLFVPTNILDFLNT